MTAPGMWRWLLAASLLTIPLDTVAQTRAARPPRIEFTGGAGFTTAAGLGTANADLRANGPARDAFTLFRTETRQAASFVADARVGWILSPRIKVEGRLGYSRPALETSVSADAEGAAPVTVVERIDQYVIDAGIVVGLDEVRFRRLVPYVAAGAGYVRWLHEGLVAIEQGHVYHLGGGVKYDLATRNRGVIRAAGLRADVRVYFLSGGIALESGVITQGTVTAGVFVGF